MAHICFVFPREKFNFAITVPNIAIKCVFFVGDTFVLPADYTKFGVAN